MEKLLRERAARDDAFVINGGVPDYSTFESLVNLAYRLLAFRPDVVVVYHGFNDLRQGTQSGNTPDNAGYRRCWTRPLPDTVFWRVFTHLHLLRVPAILSGRFRAPHLTRYVGTPDRHSYYPDRAVWSFEEPPLSIFIRNLRSIGAVCREFGIELALCTISFNEDSTKERPADFALGVSQMNRAVRHVAGSEGVSLIDVAGRMPQDPADWSSLLYLSEKGSRVRAEIVADGLFDLAAVRSWAQSAHSDGRENAAIVRFAAPRTKLKSSRPVETRTSTPRGAFSLTSNPVRC